jgi:predicted DNA-binding protein
MVKPAKFSARLTEEQRRRLAAAAMATQLTESAMLRQLIDKSLAKLPEVPIPARNQLQSVEAEPWIQQ